MKIKKRTIWLVLIVLLYSAWAAASVSAHAVLLRSNPSANAVLDQPPIQVELFFSEPLEPNLSSITVIDSNNLIVDARDARVDPSNPKRMTVTLHSLPDGVYTVSEPEAVAFRSWGFQYDELDKVIARLIFKSLF